MDITGMITPDTAPTDIYPRITDTLAFEVPVTIGRPAPHPAQRSGGAQWVRAGVAIVSRTLILAAAFAAGVYAGGFLALVAIT